MMTPLPASRFLAELPVRSEPAHITLERALKGAGAPGKVDQRVSEAAAAYERGLAEGLATGRGRLEEALAERQERLEDEFAAERERWAAEQGERLRSDLERGLADLEVALVDTMARLLGPLLEDSLKRLALAELERLIKAAIRDEEVSVVRVSGPPGLTRSLADSQDFAVVEVPGEESEIKIAVAGAVLETRLGEWIDKLGQIIDEQ